MDNIPLPPASLRTGTRKQRFDDDVFITSGTELLKSIGWMCEVAENQASKENDEPLIVDKFLSSKITSYSDLLRDRTILDLGCGPVRLLSSLRKLGIPYQKYLGIDVDKDCIDWAHENYSSGIERFLAINVQNERYNPNGNSVEGIRLPVDSSGYDLVVVRSVFTHMRLRAIEVYLSELHRIVDAKGFVYLSAYVEDGGELEIENPSQYRGREFKNTGPLHRVILNREHFEHLVRSAGFKIRVLCWHIFGQPTYLLSK